MKQIKQKDLLVSGIVLTIVAISLILYADDYDFMAGVIVIAGFLGIGIGLFALLNRE